MLVSDKKRRQCCVPQSIKKHNEVVNQQQKNGEALPVSFMNQLFSPDVLFKELVADPPDAGIENLFGRNQFSVALTLKQGQIGFEPLPLPRPSFDTALTANQEQVLPAKPRCLQLESSARRL